jgi:hypothetical protein
MTSTKHKVKHQTKGLTMQTKLDIAAALTFIGCMTFISIASPALYILLCIVLGFIFVVGVAFIATKELLASDDAVENIIGMHVALGLLSALCGMGNE